MEPVKHSSHNFNYGPPSGVSEEEIGNLSCRRELEDGYPLVTSHWKPSAEELEILNAGGTVRLGVNAAPIPPLRVGVEAPE